MPFIIRIKLNHRKNKKGLFDIQCEVNEELINTIQCLLIK